jgi:hypothetical protein
MLELFQQNLRRPGSIAAAFLLGYFLQEKGLQFDEKASKWSIAFPKIFLLSKKLLKNVSMIQLKGDHAAATKLLQKVFQSPTLPLKPLSFLEQARLITKEALLQQKLKGISVTYEVKDLPLALVPSKPKIQEKPLQTATETPKQLSGDQAGQAKPDKAKGKAGKSKPEGKAGKSKPEGKAGKSKPEGKAGQAKPDKAKAKPKKSKAKVMTD